MEVPEGLAGEAPAPSLGHRFRFGMFGSLSRMQVMAELVKEGARQDPLVHQPESSGVPRSAREDGVDEDLDGR